MSALLNHSCPSSKAEQDRKVVLTEQSGRIAILGQHWRAMAWCGLGTIGRRSADVLFIASLPTLFVVVTLTCWIGLQRIDAETGEARSWALTSLPLHHAAPSRPLIIRVTALQCPSPRFSGIAPAFALLLRAHSNLRYLVA